MIIDIKNETDVALLKRAIDGKVVGLTSGCYDLFHHLHLVYLTRCRRLCDILLVGVDSNDLVTKVKGPDRPLIPEHQRVAVIAAQSCVHVAFIMGSVSDFEYAVHALGVNKIFKNQDTFAGEKVAGADVAELVIIKDIEQHSSTSQIVDMIAKQVHIHKKEQENG